MATQRYLLWDIRMTMLKGIPEPAESLRHREGKECVEVAQSGSCG